MNNIVITDDFKTKYPNIRLGCLQAEVIINDQYPLLLERIEEKTQEIENKYTTKSLSTIPTITATRAAYKALGKDPSRYRPSAEALLRRIVQGKGLYQINNVVDLLNLVSISTGFSIGGYNAEKIDGAVQLSIGIKDEPYQAIGRGQLNIGGLPTLRDNISAFGSPTSDSERTMVGNDTQHFLMVFFDFVQNKDLEHALNQSTQLLKEFAEGRNFEQLIVTP